MRAAMWGDGGEFPPAPEDLDACRGPHGEMSREAATEEYDPDDDEARALGLFP